MGTSLTRTCKSAAVVRKPWDTCKPDLAWHNNDYLSLRNTAMIAFDNEGA